MDSLSSEITLEFVLNPGQVPRNEDIRTRNAKVLADVEGQLTIATREGVLFREDGVLLLELGVDLSNWLDEWKKGYVRDFEYVTMDHDSEPILFFMQQGDNKFLMDSPWKLLEKGVEVGSNALARTVEAFLLALRDSLSKELGVDLHDYV